MAIPDPKCPRYCCAIDAGSGPSKTATVLGRREADGTICILHCWVGEVPWYWVLWIGLLSRLGLLKVVMERGDTV